MIAVLAAVALFQERNPDGSMFLRGTIVSVRGDLLIVKPMLRPKIFRVAVAQKTTILGMERTRAPLLRPGFAVAIDGRLQGDELRFGFMVAAPTALGPMNMAQLHGTIKSAQPFIVHESSGKDVRIQVGPDVTVMRMYPLYKNSLLIGSRIDVEGRLAPDGVLQADSVQPEAEYASSGTMFGRVVSVHGRELTLVPRFTKDRVTVSLLKNLTLQTEQRMDPDDIKLGQRVTVWGLYSGDPHPTPDRAGLLAIALILGPGRYPKSSQKSGGEFISGKIESLEPNVVLRSDDGKRVRIVVPAQLIVARLTPARPDDLKPGSNAMFVLKPKAGGGFDATSVVLNASPWVGYGN